MKTWKHKIDISVTELDKELNAFASQGYEIFRVWKSSYDKYEIIAWVDDVKAGDGRRSGHSPLSAKDFSPQEANMI